MSETTNLPAAPDSSDKTKQPDKAKTVNIKKDVKKKPKTAVDELTAEEREAVTIVFHQFETGLREGTIFTKVRMWLWILHVFLMVEIRAIEDLIPAFIQW